MQARRGEAGGLLYGASVHPESPAHARPALAGSHGPLPLQRRLADQRLWLSLCPIHPRPEPFAGVRGLPVRAGQERWRTVVNGGAQYSKACEGASLPWVQIPPPPPLTCKNTGSWQPPGGCLGTPWLINLSQLGVACGAAAGINRGCCAWSRTPWTGVTGEAHAAEACALPFTAGRGRPRPAGYLPTYDRMTLSDRGVLENARRPADLGGRALCAAQVPGGPDLGILHRRDWAGARVACPHLGYPPDGHRWSKWTR
jgi:hypothetical protein